MLQTNPFMHVKFIEPSQEMALVDQSQAHTCILCASCKSAVTTPSPPLSSIQRSRPTPIGRGVSASGPASTSIDLNQGHTPGFALSYVISYPPAHSTDLT